MTKKQNNDVDIQFYTKTTDLWDDMHADCTKAEQRIHFTQYMIYDDNIGCKFLDCFEEKAKDGVKIDLLFDPVGSHMVRDISYIDRIKQAGGKISFYNDVKWWNIFTPHRWFPRNHSKLMYIDDNLTYVGGMCVADFMADWRDLHAKITGDLENADGIRMVHSNQHPSRKSRRQVYQALLERIDNAQDYMLMTTPYCVPPKSLLKAWDRAIKRGVDITLIISDETDNPIADHTAKYYLRKLLRMGMKVHFYDKSVLHAKYTIIDGKWATFGSTNLDYLSLCRNKEVNIFVERRDVINQLQDIFNDMLSECRTATRKDWDDLPVTQKIAGVVGRMIRRYL